MKYACCPCCDTQPQSTFVKIVARCNYDRIGVLVGHDEPCPIHQKDDHVVVPATPLATEQPSS